MAGPKPPAIRAGVLAALGSGVVIAITWLVATDALRRRRQRKESERQKLIERTHAEAVARGETGYFDPETGLFVFTALQHQARGYCCGSGCRHCPYDHVNVPGNQSATGDNSGSAPRATPSAKSPIYTRTGDRGITSTSGGERRSKDHPHVVVSGELDELNSNIGLCGSAIAEHLRCVAAGSTPSSAPLQRYTLLQHQLHFVQHKLFDVGSCVGSAAQVAKRTFRAEDVKLLEEWIEDVTDTVPNVASFIIPAGDRVTCHLHVARTVCRRAERSLVLLNGLELVHPAALQFINRLSDFLFAAARLAHHLADEADIPLRRNAVWVPPDLGPESPSIPPGNG